jgi:HAE1 family hydrophobic/amphiphilic exporter-1
VLIPLLLMGGIIGRLFREFAVTLSMTIAVSAVVSLTLTPMMASRFLVSSKDTRHGRLYDLSERAFAAVERLRARPRRRAQIPLGHAAGFLRDLALSVYLVRHHPEGVLPAAGYRPDHRHFRGGAGRLLRRHDAKHQEALGAIVLKDPAVAHVAMAIGGTGNRAQHRAMFITLKPRDQRTRPRIRLSRDCTRNSTRSRAEIVPAGRAGRDRRRTRLAHPVSVHLQDSDSTS